jgi:hypothetical protein
MPGADRPSTDSAWQTVTVADIRPGDHVRHGLREFDVARIQSPFLGQTALVCLIEDTPQRWLAHPAGVTLEIEVLR